MADSLRAGILKMSATAIDMFGATREAFLRPSPLSFERFARWRRDLHYREKRPTEQVAMQLRDYHWSLGPAERLAVLPSALERMGDALELLMEWMQRIRLDGIPFSERAFTEILRLLVIGASVVTGVTTAFRTEDRTLLPQLQRVGVAFRVRCDVAALEQGDRLLQVINAPRASEVFLPIWIIARRSNVPCAGWWRPSAMRC